MLFSEKIFIKQTMLSVHVLAAYILPHTGLAQNIAKNIVRTEHLLQRREHPTGTTWLQR